MYICTIPARYSKMSKKIIGRKNEVLLLKELITSSKAEFVAIYGRRRIGKTYLVKNVYAENISFEFTGILWFNSVSFIQDRSYYLIEV